MRRIVPAAVAVAALAALHVPSVGAAPPGALNPVGCVALPAAAELLGCAPGSSALMGVHDLQLGPGDRQLYVGGAGTLSTYTRDAATGALTAAGCRGEVSAGCVDDPRVGNVNALALAPDGSDIYAALGSDGIVRYRRAADGALSFAECVTVAPTVGCTTAPGLSGASDVVVSPDGEQVYVAAYTTDSVVAFDRAPATGDLTFKECITTNAGEPGCVDVAAPLGGQLLGSATALAMPADGSRLYVSARYGRSAVVFTRDGSGALVAPVGLESDDFLDGAQTIAVAPAGDAAYVGLFDGAGLTALATGGGAPSLLHCMKESPTVACATEPKVGNVFGLAFSPGAERLYAVSRDRGQITTFDRGPDGSLSRLDCLGASIPSENVELQEGCRQGPGGLYGGYAVAASADGRSVYVASGQSLTTLAPEPSPEPPVTPAQPAAARATVVAKRLRLNAHGRLRVGLRCPARAATRCTGRVSLRSARKLKLRRGAKRRFVKLGQARFSIAPGATATVAVKVPKAARRLVAARKRLGARLTIATPAATRQVGGVTVLAPKPKAKRRRR